MKALDLYAVLVQAPKGALVFRELCLSEKKAHQLVEAWSQAFDEAAARRTVIVKLRGEVVHDLLGEEPNNG